MRGSPARLLLAPLLLTCGATSCLSVDWIRRMENQPIPDEVRDALPTGGIDLTEVLARLGAPTHVWEYRVHGLVLAWAATNNRTLGGRISVPVTENQSLSFSYDDIRSRQKGLVLWFDENWELVRWREGYLRDLVGTPPPPATIEAIERKS